MKNSLLEILLNLFESAMQFKKDDPQQIEVVEDNLSQTEFLRVKSQDSKRIFVYHERVKFSKESLILLFNLFSSNVLSTKLLESVIDQLLFSDSHIITYEETKALIYNVAAESLDASELAFLELLFYQKEDGMLIN